ncbi:MAG: hypothetical protein KJ619_00375 [Candidatus Omnitrophica bacterium]|nr:hypothetical protein [Candidatus Omnitrophota bacterium]
MQILNRYCPYLDTNCEKPLLPEKELKVFLAYPSHKRIAGYIASLLKCDELKALDIFPWEKLSDSAGIIFCKICEQIIESQVFVADITYLNQNVLLELGYAIAKKKLPILIKEENREGSSPDILKDIKHIGYSDIHELARKLSEAVFEPYPFPDFSVEDSELTISFITAQANMPVKRSIYKTIESFAKKADYTIFVDDTSEMPPSHKLSALFKKIEQSSIIVFHMVGTDFKNYNEINAYVAFLAGYALGRQKKMLVLQEAPPDKMIDLHQLRKEYKDSKEAVKILEAFLAPVKEEREEYLKRTKRKKQYERIDLGHPAAEYDINLDEYFVDTPEFSDMRKLRKFLLLGRRGVGKTANFFQLRKEFSEHSQNIITSISPFRLQLASSIEAVYNRVGDLGARALFEMFWEYLILTEIAIRSVRYIKKRKYLMRSDIFDKIEALIQKNIDMDLEFDLRFANLVEKFSEKIFENGGRNLRATILQSFYKDFFPELKVAIAELSRYHPIVVLIDNLDRDWSSASMESMASLINSLLDVMNNVNIYNKFGNCRVITFLRSDIYNLSSRYDPDGDKRQPSRLTWSGDKLKEIISERIAESKGDFRSDSQSLWESVFKKQLGKIEDTFEYVVTRTMLRPRDILTFCTTILEKIHKSGKGIISEQIIYDAEKSYSEYLLKSLRQEFGVGYPDIEEICICLFLGRSHKLTESEFKRRITDNYKIPPGYKVEDMIRFCYETGMVGISFESKTFFVYQGWEYSKLINRARVAKDFNFILHRGLWNFLDVKN